MPDRRPRTRPRLRTMLQQERPPDWTAISVRAYGNAYADPTAPKICIVSARYTGVYEGGLFVAVPVADLDSDAFGGDGEASEWWAAHAGRVGSGDTPDAALLDWYQKQQAKG